MDLESEIGIKIALKPGSTTQLGRELGLGFSPSSSDPTISRHHLSVFTIDELGVGFEVIGKNPIWVCGGDGGGGRLYRNSEKGELEVGDKFSLSLKKPIFFVVRRREGESGMEEKRVLEAVERREKRTMERRREKERGEEEGCVDGGGDERVIGCLDFSQIDPVKEFGFILKGHEFDQYLKKMTLDIKNWNWFLDEESRNNREDDEAIGEVTSSKGKKRKGGASDDDEEWTTKSEEEREIVSKGQNTKHPKYSTRSKDQKRPQTDSSRLRRPSMRKDVKDPRGEVEEEAEEDETLGGFIVDYVEEEEEEEEEEESEEEFDDEEED